MAGSDLFPVAGMKIYIGNVLATQITDFVEGDFSGQSWVEIDGWQRAGAFGDAAALITSQLINRNRDVKQKGTSNSGSMQNVFAVVPGDAGQAALKSAALPADKNNYAFRVDFNDADGGDPSKAYFVGIALTAQEAGGEANTIRTLNATIEINSNIVDVAAT